MRNSYKTGKKIIVPKLKEIREYFSLNQSDFAEFLGIEQNYFSRYENGIHEFPDELKIKLIDIIMLKYEKRININWLLSGEGEMFLPEQSKKPKKSNLVTELGALIDQRLERIEAEIAELKGHLKGTGKDAPDSGLYVSELEPEYGEEHGKTVFVEDLAAGPLIDASEDQSSYIDVPKRLMNGNPKDYYVARIRGTSMTAAGIPDGVLVLIRKSDVARHGAIQVVEHQGEVSLKRLMETPGEGWRICFDDLTGRFIKIDPGDEFHVQGDFVAVLPEDNK